MHTMFEWPFSRWTRVGRFLPRSSFSNFFRREPRGISGTCFLQSGCPSCYPSVSIKTEHKALTVISGLVLSFLCPPTDVWRNGHFPVLPALLCDFGIYTSLFRVTENHLNKFVKVGNRIIANTEVTWLQCCHVEKDLFGLSRLRHVKFNRICRISDSECILAR